MLAVGLALLSSFLFALAATLQQMEAGSLDREQASSIKMLLVLVRRPRWLLGVAADAGGFITVALALAIGRLVVVQPLVVTVLLFALPLSARLTGRRITRSDWVSQTSPSSTRTGADRASDRPMTRAAGMRRASHPDRGPQTAIDAEATKKRRPASPADRSRRVWRSSVAASTKTSAPTLARAPATSSTV